MTHYLPRATPEYDTAQLGCETADAPMLSAEAERALGRRWHDRHDGAAAHLLVSDSLPTVAKIAAAYGQRYGLRVDDLTGECYVGLMCALCQFDPDCSERFAAYASCRMHAAVQGFILRKWSGLKLGTRAAQQSLLARLRHTHARLRELECRPSGSVSLSQGDAKLLAPRRAAARATRRGFARQAQPTLHQSAAFA